MDLNDSATWDVLAVDDDSSILGLLQYVFSFQHTPIRVASSGRQALQQIEEKQPTLVLLDLMMPGLTGWDVVKQIRENALLQDLPVIAVTAYPIDDDGEGLKAAGFNGYIAKPISPLGLVNFIRSILSAA